MDFSICNAKTWNWIKNWICKNHVKILGFWHEQSRTDRDNYITTNWRNVEQSKRYNFDKCKSGQCSNQGLPYDIYSVMQYPSWAFAINRRIPVMTSKACPSCKLGGDNFSQSDIDGIKKMYCGRDDTTTTTTTTNTNNGNKCRDRSKDCRAWARSGYCRGGGYLQVFMKKSCKKSCRLC